MKILKRMLQKIQTIKRRKLIEILNSKKKMPISHSICF